MIRLSSYDRDQCGSGKAEYILLVVVVAMLSIAAAALYGRNLRATNSVSTNAMGGKVSEATKSAGLWGPKPLPNAQKGVEFASNTGDLYPAGPGKSATVRISYAGSRKQDFDAANRAAGFPSTPGGYTWHHVDDYDSTSNSGTMQLVRIGAHEATYPHNGGVRQYERATGKQYR